PTPADVDVPSPDARGKPLSFKMGKPVHVGYYEGDLDVPVYKVTMTAESGGEAIWSGEMYAVNHPAHGSLLSHTKPSQMIEVAPGTPPPTADPVTRAGKFVPNNEVERRAADAWMALKDTTYTGPKMTSFEEDFLPM